MISESALTNDMEIVGPEDGMPEIPEANIVLYRASEATSSAVDTLADFLIAHFNEPLHLFPSTEVRALYA